MRSLASFACLTIRSFTWRNNDNVVVVLNLDGVERGDFVLEPMSQSGGDFPNGGFSVVGKLTSLIAQLARLDFDEKRSKDGKRKE
jgi:hypothetical protein